MNAIYILKKSNFLSFSNGKRCIGNYSFQLGDYIPNSVFISQLYNNESEQVFHSFLKELKENVKQLNLVEKEKGLIKSFIDMIVSVDYQLTNLKNQFNSLKNELNYYKDFSIKSGAINQSNSIGKSTRQASAVCRDYLVIVVTQCVCVFT